jgi:hypothetical protein
MALDRCGESKAGGDNSCSAFLFSVLSGATRAPSEQLLGMLLLLLLLREGKSSSWEGTGCVSLDEMMRAHSPNKMRRAATGPGPSLADQGRGAALFGAPGRLK